MIDRSGGVELTRFDLSPIGFRTFGLRVAEAAKGLGRRLLG